MPNPERLASTYISSRVTPNTATIQKSVTPKKCVTTRQTLRSIEVLSLSFGIYSQKFALYN